MLWSWTYSCHNLASLDMSIQLASASILKELCGWKEHKTRLVLLRGLSAVSAVGTKKICFGQRKALEDEDGSNSWGGPSLSCCSWETAAANTSDVNKRLSFQWLIRHVSKTGSYSKRDKNRATQLGKPITLRISLLILVLVLVLFSSCMRCQSIYEPESFPEDVWSCQSLSWPTFYRLGS